jgi:REP element-mobilizing transposase RayT
MSMFLLTPNEVVNQVMQYCLAWAAQGRGILIHAVSVQSNHYHMVVTDTEGKLSEFVQELNRCVARCLLAYYRTRFPQRRVDALWTPSESFGATLLVNANAVLDEIVYTLTNPVKDELVHDYRKWPGFNTRPGDWRGVVRRARRPGYYFKDTPETLEYQIVPPSQLDRGDLEGLIADVQAHIRDRQRQAAADLAAQGRRFMGAKAVLRTGPFDSPSTPRAVGEVNPRVAAGGDKAALELAVQALRAFREAYRQAWELFKRGAEVVFPGGTLLLRKRFRVPCDPLDAACWCQLAST